MSLHHLLRRRSPTATPTSLLRVLSQLTLSPATPLSNPNHSVLPSRSASSSSSAASSSSSRRSREFHHRIQSLIHSSDLDAASRLVRRSLSAGSPPSIFTCNTILSSLLRAKRYSDVVSMFEYFFEKKGLAPNIVSYNILIDKYCDEGRVDSALEVYRKVIAEGKFSPSSVTYSHLTKGLVGSGKVEEAADLLREMLERGNEADSLVFNNVIRGFLDSGDFEKANELFNELKERCGEYDGVVNATFMEWWFKQGKEEEAMESYKSLMDKNFRMSPATCNVLLEVLLRYGKKEAGRDLFEQMLDNHTPPTFHGVNSDTFSMMVNECFKEGKVSEAVDTFKKVGRKPESTPFAMDVAGYNNIVARFCENDMLEEAEKFFGEMTSKSVSPDLMSFATLIDAYLKVEKVDDVLRLLNKMAEADLRVDGSFGSKVFGELIKRGKGADATEILKKLGEKDPKLDSSIYDVAIRELCDAGELDFSKEVLEQMKKHGLTPASSLKKFVKDTFGRAGQSNEIESVFGGENNPQLSPLTTQLESSQMRSLSQPKIAMIIKSFAGSNSMMGQPKSWSSQVRLPDKRVLFTVNRSPHVDKKSREQFEMIFKKQYLNMRAGWDELQNKYFWLKRLRIFGAQYELVFSTETHLGSLTDRIKKST
ncbi:hypothetical protein Tsubulata_049009 [Turnera subulata]|uniref:Small ribosomal subunit protein uS10 domain-containing protein n=1 Tax=Turnera subulata TaxID=218843 RepID=A0A9Q0J511_9ROSI|nr:hypothetical protein Tsubulata_049009 [Turnera subulata]